MKFVKIHILAFMVTPLLLLALSAIGPISFVGSAKAQSAAAGQTCTTADGKNGITQTSGECAETTAKICGSLPEALCQTVVTAPADPQTNPLGGFKPILDAITNILIGLFGIFAVFVLVISGVQISASAGNESAIKSAKENIFKVVTGLVLLISFRAIISLINNLFNGVDTGNLFCAAGNSVELCQGGIPALLGNAISVASFFSGVVAVIFVIIGGIRYTTSGGSQKALEGAKKTIIYAVAGLVLSLSAYGILVFIQTQLTR
jgi:hypothetical protein